jgi:FixJ family two-component response regulator
LSKLSVISIIDDDALIRAATANFVRSLGYVVQVCASAEEFLRSADLNSTACVIADVQMPVMTGTELQSHLRAQGNRVPFIFITAFPDEGARARALGEGAVCFLTKPLDGSTLIECLDRALDEHGSQPQS